MMYNNIFNNDGYGIPLISSHNNTIFYNKVIMI
ncbi:MAG: hypothetical protein ACFFG0_35495 [Candidatus Thorarchaeota archaeon]